jgi:hypothetical protein
MGGHAQGSVWRFPGSTPRGESPTDGPCGEVSHKYLHTHYTPRGDYLV